MYKASMDVRTPNTLGDSQVLNSEIEMQRPTDRSDTLREQSSDSYATGRDFRQALYQRPVGRERSASEPADYRQLRRDFESLPQEEQNHENDTPEFEADTRTDQPEYYPAHPGNDEEMGLDRSGNDAYQNSAIEYGKKFGKWLVTPTGNYVPEKSEFVPGSGWKAYAKHVEITCRRALMTPLGDAGLNAGIATVNNANTWLQAGRVIPASAVGSLIGTYAANKALDRLPKPWDKVGQTAVGQGATLGITYAGEAISKALHKE